MHYYEEELGEYSEKLAFLRQYEKKIYELRQIIEISKSLYSTLEYEKIIDTILLTCMGHIQTFEGFIFLPKVENIGDRDLYLKEVKGIDVGKNFDKFHIPYDSIFISHLKAVDECVLFDTILRNPEFYDIQNVLKPLRPAILVPMKVRGEINGIIGLGKRITQDERYNTRSFFLLTIGQLAGQAVENARLYEMATVDKLTRLKMRHIFDITIESEVYNVRFQGKPLSLVMLDVDNFKSFNDTYGHQVGDKVLQEVGRLIKNNIRKTDIACRYGGEEFAIIFPNTPLVIARNVAERIRKKIEEHKLIVQGREIQITVSIGVAQYSLDIESELTPKELIERADKALYFAKQLGKNRVVTYEEAISHNTD